MVLQDGFALTVAAMMFVLMAYVVALLVPCILGGTTIVRLVGGGLLCAILLSGAAGWVALIRMDGGSMASKLRDLDQVAATAEDRHLGRGQVSSALIERLNGRVSAHDSVAASCLALRDRIVHAVAGGMRESRIAAIQGAIGPGQFTLRFLMLLALLGLLALGSRVLDLALDVAWWLGRPSGRIGLEKAVLSKLGAIRDRYPDARVLVVGHSLGSVVVTAAVATLHYENQVGTGVAGPISVVTMGSPLNYLWRLFPTRLASPRQLLLTYRTCAATGLWLNVWRSGDQVGRAMDADGAGFRQVCIGNGGHGNYWGDARVWRAVAPLARGETSAWRAGTMKTNSGRGTAWLCLSALSIVAALLSWLSGRYLFAVGPG
ncbi:MAG: hypothetical protein AB8H80_20120 [Planctomycetota bacterium]